MSLPRERKFLPSQVEILRVLGKIDIKMDGNDVELLKRNLKGNGLQKDGFDQIKKSGRATSARLFEARLTDGTKCFLKEYLPLGTNLSNVCIALSSHPR